MSKCPNCLEELGAIYKGGAVRCRNCAYILRVVTKPAKSIIKKTVARGMLICLISLFLLMVP